jgi:hypothetical protein
MSYTFRAVKETWYDAADCFVEPKAVVTLLHDLAARADTRSSERVYGDTVSVWFEHGKKVLDYVAKDRRFRAASFQDSLEEQGVAVEQADLAALIETMKTLAKPWRNAVGAHGELVFYVDAY